MISTLNRFPLLNLPPVDLLGLEIPPPREVILAPGVTSLSLVVRIVAMLR